MQDYKFFANILELRREQFERNTAHMNLSKEEKDRRWRIFEQQQAAEMAAAMNHLSGTHVFAPFVSNWLTTATSAGSSNSNQVRLPLVSNGTYRFFVDWGDGFINSISSWNQAEVTHTYSTTGNYTITIYGICIGWAFNNTGDKLKIRNITRWGCLRFVNPGTDINSGFFNGCSQMNLSTVQDAPSFYNLSSIRNMFRGCTNASFSINNINSWDLTNIADASGLFYNCPSFNQDVGSWNTANITNMSNMFNGGGVTSVFNNGGSPAIGSWNTSKVADFSGMFGEQSSFNQNIGNWNVGSATSMNSMFMCSVVDGIFNNGANPSIGGWNTSNVTNMSRLFAGQPAFNQPIGSWNTSKVTDMSYLFYSYNLPTNSRLKNSFNQPIANWDTSKVTNMEYMFASCNFNQPIGSWNTSSLTNLTYTFAYTNFFNQSINSWDTSKVTTLFATFIYADAFNLPLSGWNTSNVTTMASTFYKARFNQPIGNWDTYKVTTFSNCFRDALAFNQDISNWSLASCNGLGGMFRNAKGFDRSLAAWNLAPVLTRNLGALALFMAQRPPAQYSTANYNALLISLAAQPVPNNCTLDMGTIKYTSAATTARNSLLAKGWTILDGGI